MKTKSGALERTLRLEAMRLVHLIRQVRLDRDPTAKHQIVANGPGRQGEGRRQERDGQTRPVSLAQAESQREHAPREARYRSDKGTESAEQPPTHCRFPRVQWLPPAQTDDDEV